MECRMRRWWHRKPTSSIPRCWPGPETTRFSSTCFWTTPATWRSIPSSRNTSARSSHRCWRSGARAIRSFCHRARKPSSATFRRRKCSSMTPGTSLWKPTTWRLQRPFANSWAASSRRRPPLLKSVRSIEGQHQPGARLQQRAPKRLMKGKNLMNDAKGIETVVLVHAAWADGSSWNKVTEELQRKGLNVVAAQIPLTSFTDDVASLRKVLLRQEGPLVLAGHSYGGAVISAAAAGNPNVKALVYIAAVVPDEGETVGDVFHRVASHPSAPKLQHDADGFLWLNVDAFRTAVAPDASLSETALMAATQKPISVIC